MLVNIYKPAANLNEWAPSRPTYTFEPGDAAPFAIIEVPSGWMLVGEPPALVKRLDSNILTNRDATEALTSALMGAEGFAIHQPPAGGMPMLWAQHQAGDVQAHVVVMGVGGDRLVPPATTDLALPSPSKNGRSRVPARRAKE